MLGYLAVPLRLRPQASAIPAAPPDSPRTLATRRQVPDTSDVSRNGLDTWRLGSQNGAEVESQTESSLATFPPGVTLDESTDDILLPATTRRARRGGEAGLTVMVARPLTDEDLPLLLGPLTQALPAKPGLASIRYSHHQAARLITQGLDLAEVAEITGYAPSTLRSLQSDPAFCELLAFYATGDRESHNDVLEQMSSLGRSALNELLERLEAKPQEFSKRELLELAEKMLTPTQLAARSNSLGASPMVSVNVKFVAPSTDSAHVNARAGAIDAEVIS